MEKCPDVLTSGHPDAFPFHFPNKQISNLNYLPREINELINKNILNQYIPSQPIKQNQPQKQKNTFIPSKLPPKPKFQIGYQSQNNNNQKIVSNYRLATNTTIPSNNYLNIILKNQCQIESERATITNNII